MKIERGEASWVVEMGERVTQLECAKATLSSARAEADPAKAKAVEARRLANANDEEMRESKAQRQAARQTITTYREAICTGAEPLQEDVPKLLAKLGMEAPELSPSSDNISVSEMFQWLWACVAMADSGSPFSDLSVVVAARTLSATICKLLPSGTGADVAVMKAQL